MPFDSMRVNDRKVSITNRLRLHSCSRVFSQVLLWMQLRPPGAHEWFHGDPKYDGLPG